MQVGIIRRVANESQSMDVYADGIMYGLQKARPDWRIIEIKPDEYPSDTIPLIHGIQKYFQRYWSYPNNVRTYTEVDLFHIVDHSDAHIVYWLTTLSKPVIVTCHDLINFIQPQNIAEQAKVPVISMAAWKFAVRGLRQANHIISVSNYTARDITKILTIASDHVSVIPDAVESRFRPLDKDIVNSLRQHHGVSRWATCILNVGSNQYRKNVISILRVVRELVERKIPTYFLKVGSDFTAAQKDYIQQNSLNDHINYLGKVSKDTLVQAYNMADVLMTPSLYEGFGMTTLEAMACGTPVITSNTSSLPEVVGDAGILVDPMDIQGMVDAVCRLREDSAYRQSLINRGIERAKRFTWEETGEQIAQVYERTLTEIC